jgi:hypothetical protein
MPIQGPSPLGPSVRPQPPTAEVAPAAARTLAAEPGQAALGRDRIDIGIRQAQPGQDYYDVTNGRISNAVVIDMPDASPEAVVARMKQGGWQAFWPGADMRHMRVEGGESWAATFEFFPNHRNKDGKVNPAPVIIRERISEAPVTTGRDGGTVYRLDISMSGDFEGKGYYEFTRLPNNGTRVKAVWEGVKPPPELTEPILSGPFRDAHLGPIREAFSALNRQLGQAPRPDAEALEAQANASFNALEQLLPGRLDAPRP